MSQESSTMQVEVEGEITPGQMAEMETVLDQATEQDVQEFQETGEIRRPYPGDLSGRRVIFESRRRNYLDQCKQHNLPPRPTDMPDYLASCVREIILQRQGQIQ
jgi:hypothetical protein